MPVSSPSRSSLSQMPGSIEPVVLEPPELEPLELEPPELEAVALVAAVFVVTFALLLTPPTLLAADMDAVDTTVPVAPLVVLALVCAEVAVGPPAFVCVTVAGAALVDSGLSLLEHPTCETTSVANAKGMWCRMRNRPVLAHARPSVERCRCFQLSHAAGRSASVIEIGQPRAAKRIASMCTK